MTNGDAIYYIKQLAVLSTEREMPKIEEALKTAIKALSEDYAKGFQSGYKAKEYDRQSDCDGCKFDMYKEGKRCEGCCRNYADGYVAEQIEPQTIRCPKCGRTDYIRSLEKDFGVSDKTFKYKCINCNTYIKTEPQTDCAWK